MASTHATCEKYIRDVMFVLDRFKNNYDAPLILPKPPTREEAVAYFKSMEPNKEYQNHVLKTMKYVESRDYNTNFPGRLMRAFRYLDPSDPQWKDQMMNHHGDEKMMELYKTNIHHFLIRLCSFRCTEDYLTYLITSYAETTPNGVALVIMWRICCVRPDTASCMYNADSAVETAISCYIRGRRYTKDPRYPIHTYGIWDSLLNNRQLGYGVKEVHIAWKDYMDSRKDAVSTILPKVLAPFVIDYI